MLECKPVTAPDTRTLFQGSKATDAAKRDPAHGQPYCSPYQETCIPRESNHELPRRGSTCSCREEPQAMQASEPVQRAVFPVRPLKEAAGARVQHDLSQIDRRPAPAIRLDNLSSPSRYHLRLVTISVSSPSQSRHHLSLVTISVSSPHQPGYNDHAQSNKQLHIVWKPCGGASAVPTTPQKLAGLSHATLVVINSGEINKGTQKGIRQPAGMASTAPDTAPQPAVRVVDRVSSQPSQARLAGEKDLSSVPFAAAEETDSCVRSP